MKKCCFSIAVLSLSALAFVSCKKDEKPAVSGDMMTFTGRIGGGGAKTEIDGFEMTWSEGDQVRINGKVFDSELTSDHKTATFTGEYLMPPYGAYYPASLYKDGEYVLPDTQHYAGVNGKVLSGVSPMYAESSSADLTFHNICALIRLSVTGDGTVKAVKVSSATSLSGEFEIKGNADDGFYAKLKSASSKAAHDTLTLDCGVGVMLNETTATTFYVAVPKGTYTDLKFTLIDDVGGTCLSAAGSPVLEAGKLYAKELADVKFVKPATLPGEFSVSANTKVKFSRGNLYYDGTDSKWKFEADQWETTPTAVDQNDSGGTYSSSHVSHFYWSKTASGAYAESYSAGGESLGDVFFTNATETTANQNFQVDGEEAGTWRTLSKDEWVYLINTRTDANRFAKAKVSGVQGLLIFPDGYNNGTAISGITGVSTVNSTSAGYPSGNIPPATWTSMESSGAVFLPAAGGRSGTNVNSVGSYGYSCSSTPGGVDDDGAYYLIFNLYDVSTLSWYRYNGYAVRLVR